jgi:uroporphyrinogen decarboxylase
MSMTPRERVAAALAHEEPDRVPVDWGKQVSAPHREAYLRLKAHLGHPGWMQNEDRILDKMGQNVFLDEALLEKFGVDFRWLVPHWVGLRRERLEDKEVYYDMWGSRFDWTGQFFSFAAAPLAEAKSLGDLEAHPWPDPRDPAMFAGLAEEARRLHTETGFAVGADGIKGGLLQSALWVRGYEKFFMDLGLNTAFAEALLDRLLSLFKDMYTEYLGRVGPCVQAIYLTDDLGTQSSLLISPAMFRRFLKERFRELFSHVKSLAPQIRIIYHCDGAVKRLIPDFIEIGVDALNPVQTSLEDFKDTAALKAEFGDRIAFHGGIDVQQMLNRASAGEVRADVARRIRDLAPGGGFVLAPCHNIMKDVPPENLVALFEAAGEHGVYPIH